MFPKTKAFEQTKSHHFWTRSRNSTVENKISPFKKTQEGGLGVDDSFVRIFTFLPLFRDLLGVFHQFGAEDRL